MFDRIAATTMWIWIASMILGMVGLALYLVWDVATTLVRTLFG